jgi:hypothetical protein
VTSLCGALAGVEEESQLDRNDQLDIDDPAAEALIVSSKDGSVGLG